MEVVWRCSAKSLEYGIWGERGMGGWRRRFLLGQPNVWKNVSDRAIGIHVRVIVNADGFVTIATALPSFSCQEYASGG
jgi:hypothetical protein